MSESPKPETSGRNPDVDDTGQGTQDHPDEDSGKLEPMLPPDRPTIDFPEEGDMDYLKKSR